VRSTEPSESGQPPRARTRRRFSRTFSRARWPEYGRLLKTAIGAGYQVVALESFLDGAVDPEGGPVLILRHDVDQHPSSALRMSDVEVALGLRSTWYLRWRTASLPLVEELRRRGGEVGFHYETLTSAVLAGDGLPADREELLRLGRERLRAEIEAFAELFGPIRSVAAHGDTRVPGVRNGDLLRGEDWSAYGVAYDANDAMRRHRLAAWVTDRSSADGGWSDEVDPVALLRAGEAPVLCLTHPNNWVSGPALWGDRIGGAIRRVSDRPPALAAGRRSRRTG
jgi:hypothetical protein